MRQIWIFGLIFLGCVADVPLYDNAYARITDYSIHRDLVTPRGVAVDQGAYQINSAALDSIVDQTEQCLIEKIDQLAPFCADEKIRCEPILKNAPDPEYWKCYDIIIGCNHYERVRHGLDRSHFRIKIAPDWHYGCDGNTAVFPCRVPEQACLDKGLHPTPACPCSCRSTVQDSDIITTPQMIALAGELVRLTTGFNNPWIDWPFLPCSSVLP